MSAATATFPRADDRGWSERVLSLFSTVRAGEGLSAILMAANVFLLLGSYYLLKTVREPLILNAPSGAEVKSYAAAGQAVLFLILVPLYGALASRVNRMKLIGFVTAFFVMNLILFASLGSAGVGIGVAFFLWVGIFNMLMVAQFWAFANDLYTEEQGKRLFPIVGVGASLGAWVGSVSAQLVYRATGPYQLMLIAAGILVVCVVLTWLVNRREAQNATSGARRAKEPLDRKGALELLRKDRYLLLIAVLVLLLNTVNTTGEYIVSRLVTESAQALPAAERGAFIGEFYGGYFSWVNLISFLMQSFLVSRLFKWIGIGGAIFVLPVIALGGYGILAAAPVLALVRWAKILENATDYSLNNMVRHALYLPTSREAKYKVKAATDTFFVRTGDMIQAGIVATGVSLGFAVGSFAVVNMALAVVWLLVALAIYRRHRRLSTQNSQAVTSQ